MTLVSVRLEVPIDVAPIDVPPALRKDEGFWHPIPTLVRENGGIIQNLQIHVVRFPAGGFPWGWGIIPGSPPPSSRSVGSVRTSNSSCTTSSSSIGVGHFYSSIYNFYK